MPLPRCPTLHHNAPTEPPQLIGVSRPTGPNMSLIKPVPEKMRLEIVNLHANRNPEWWGDLIQLQNQIQSKSQISICMARYRAIQIQSKSHCCNSNSWREIPWNLSFSILTSWLKSPHHPGFRFAFCCPFRVSSSRERAVGPGTLSPLNKSQTGHEETWLSGRNEKN